MNTLFEKSLKKSSFATLCFLKKIVKSKRDLYYTFTNFFLGTILTIFGTKIQVRHF